MVKTVALILAVLSISVLSGCVDNNISSAINETDAGNIKASINESVDAVANESNRTKALKASIGVLNLSDREDKYSATNVQDWCTPGSKITVKLPSGEKEFTVAGITTYQGKEVCKAELVYENGKTTRYFSKDGKYEVMNSSASGPGSVYSEARTDISNSG